jgi:competence protein ComEA
MRCGRWISALGVVVIVGASTLAEGSSPATADDVAVHGAANERPPETNPASAPPAIDLNTATVEQLDGLPGVGRKRAEAIIAQRQKRPFQRVTELLRIKGFGPKLFGKVRPFIVVGTAASASAREGR